MQLARPGVGHGVCESRVDSGNLFRHPAKRGRTTMTYLAVVALGTDEERTAYRRAVNVAHRGVRSTDSSPVSYNAFDPGLQLWVAACLYRGFTDVHEAFVGPLDGDRAEEIYRDCAVLGTTLQVKEEMWPADRAAFERYWNAALEEISIDDAVREYLLGIVDLKFLPGFLSRTLGPFHRFVTTGFLPARFRREMRLGWTPLDQRVLVLGERQREPDLIGPLLARLVVRQGRRAWSRAVFLRRLGQGEPACRGESFGAGSPAYVCPGRRDRARADIAAQDQDRVPDLDHPPIQPQVAGPVAVLRLGQVDVRHGRDQPAPQRF